MGMPVVEHIDPGLPLLLQQWLIAALLGAGVFLRRCIAGLLLQPLNRSVAAARLCLRNRSFGLQSRTKGTAGSSSSLSGNGLTFSCPMATGDKPFVS